MLKPSRWAGRRSRSRHFILHDDGYLRHGVGDTYRIAGVLDGPRAHALARPLLVHVLRGRGEEAYTF